ncbi:unnamed protein product [Owenia fusiformis]|uniref:Protein Lines n=1 Tax=Owenia fusiformis TaxID=6347 RepID=A0A8S4Q1A5_OWEFU|nr:unnamed protein product [Owenia fusiformis]
MNYHLIEINKLRKKHGKQKKASSCPKQLQETEQLLLKYCSDGDDYVSYSAAKTLVYILKNHPEKARCTAMLNLTIQHIIEDSSTNRAAIHLLHSVSHLVAQGMQEWIGDALLSQWKNLNEFTCHLNGDEKDITLTQLEFYDIIINLMQSNMEPGNIPNSGVCTNLDAPMNETELDNEHIRTGLIVNATDKAKSDRTLPSMSTYEGNAVSCWHELVDTINTSTIPSIVTYLQTQDNPLIFSKILDIANLWLPLLQCIKGDHNSVILQRAHVLSEALLGIDYTRDMPLRKCNVGFSGASLEGNPSTCEQQRDWPLLRKISIILLKSCATLSLAGSKESAASFTQLCYFVSSIIMSDGADEEKWMFRLYRDQDDGLIESLICVLVIYQHTVHQEARNSWLLAHRLFLNCMDHFSFDHTVLLDLLTSPETSFLLYLTKMLKLLINEWSMFIMICGHVHPPVATEESITDELVTSEQTMDITDESRVATKQLLGMNNESCVTTEQSIDMTDESPVITERTLDITDESHLAIKQSMGMIDESPVTTEHMLSMSNQLPVSNEQTSVSEQSASISAQSNQVSEKSSFPILSKINDIQTTNYNHATNDGKNALLIKDFKDKGSVLSDNLCTQSNRRALVEYSDSSTDNSEDEDCIATSHLASPNLNEMNTTHELNTGGKDSLAKQDISHSTGEMLLDLDQFNENLNLSKCGTTNPDNTEALSETNKEVQTNDDIADEASDINDGSSYSNNSDSHLYNESLLDKVMTLLIQLRFALERLVHKNLFPYNANPLIRLLEECEALYETP